GRSRKHRRRGAAGRPPHTGFAGRPSGEDRGRFSFAAPGALRRRERRVIAALMAGGLLMASGTPSPNQPSAAAACAAPIPATGVLIDWDRLVPAVAPRVRSMGSPTQTTVIMASFPRVIAQRSWSWRKGPRVLQLVVLR